VYLACTFLGPFVYLRLPFRRSCPSHGGGLLAIAFHARRGLEDPGRLGLARGRGPGPCRDVAQAPGARQVPLVLSAWDSATRNAATAVVNNGGSTPSAPPPPRQVTSQVIVAVARSAPPGCPALELV
jgi:hypothetical protein